MDVEDAADRLLARCPRRCRRSARFAELGFPTPRDEDWRFTPIKPITELNFKTPGGCRATLEGCVFAAIDGRSWCL